MSALTEEDVRSLAMLARLALTDQEVQSLRVDLSSILTHMESLASLDTEGVTPMTHVNAGETALRRDEVAGSLDRERILAASPRHDSESFAVPAILPSAGS